MNKMICGKCIRLFFVCCMVLSMLPACVSVHKYQKNIPFVFKNNIKLDANVGADEKKVINSKLNTQLDDSSKVKEVDKFFIFHTITKPPAFDTNAVARSAKNMATAMINLGFYHPEVTYKFDTIRHGKSQVRVITNYNVVAGNRTTVDTLAYLFARPDLQRLAESTKKQSPLQKGKPVTRSAIQFETGRLVELFRNHGYYKFSADQILVTGDTSIEALTSVSEDPFEQLQLLEQANEQRNKPTIRLAYQLNNLPDTSKLEKYYINNIYVLPDYRPGDLYTDSSLHQHLSKNYITLYHRKLYKFYIPNNYITMKKGDEYNQDNYVKMINGFYSLQAWETPTIDVVEKKDTNLLDLVVKLNPVKKYTFEGSVEMSYSTNSSSTIATSLGNLFGIAGNLSITNHNLWQQAAQMSNSIRAGLEFNTVNRNSYGTFINSREISYTNNILFPKFVSPFKKLNRTKLLTKQTFLNTNLSLVNRIDFFDQQIFGTGIGYNWKKKNNQVWTFKPVNFDYHRIYNRSDNFNQTLIEYPFLRYSFNTALVMGASLSFNSTHVDPNNANHITSFKANLEESGLLWDFLKQKNKTPETGNFFNQYLKEFIKGDVDYRHTISYPKSALSFHLFAGVGIPISKYDTTLPFFKQYFGGGPNSMRAWPVRGIGVGGQPLAPYSAGLFNDRTGDIQLEGNAEYRFNVAPLFSNAISFKMALFTDIGNIWNFKNTQPTRAFDSTQFKFQNLYDQLGVGSGVGFRFDFSYFLLRFDVGFRFKRPDVVEDAGWQIPDITFKHVFGGSIDDRIWRYQNFNAVIGIDYPF